MMASDDAVESMASAIPILSIDADAGRVHA
jgi:hypothetical protein